MDQGGGGTETPTNRLSIKFFLFLLQTDPLLGASYGTRGGVGSGLPCGRDGVFGETAGVRT